MNAEVEVEVIVPVKKVEVIFPVKILKRTKSSTGFGPYEEFVNPFLVFLLAVLLLLTFSGI